MQEDTRVYLNGRFVVPEEAKVSVFDRGFIFGDGVYEVIPVYSGRLFRVVEHITRLENSLRGLDIANPKSRTEWLGLLTDLIPKDYAADQFVYLQVTRGVAPRDHRFPAGVAPTVCAFMQPMNPPATADLKQGVKAITHEDSRWLYCDLKTTALLANVLLRQEAARQDACDAILHRDGAVTEGGSSTVFIVNQGTVFTPPLSEAILPGITRAVILELLEEAGIPYSEAPIGIEALREADEIWLASSTKEVLPVTALDDRIVGNGQPGAVFRRLWGLFQNCKTTFLEASTISADSFSD